jgi:hypothetical protein
MMSEFDVSANRTGHCLSAQVTGPHIHTRTPSRPSPTWWCSRVVAFSRGAIPLTMPTWANLPDLMETLPRCAAGRAAGTWALFVLEERLGYDCQVG